MTKIKHPTSGSGSAASSCSFACRAPRPTTRPGRSTRNCSASSRLRYFAFWQRKKSSACITRRQCLRGRICNCQGGTGTSWCSNIELNRLVDGLRGCPRRFQLKFSNQKFLQNAIQFKKKSKIEIFSSEVPMELDMFSKNPKSLQSSTHPVAFASATAANASVENFIFTKLTPKWQNQGHFENGWSCSHKRTKMMLCSMQ